MSLYKKQALLGAVLCLFIVLLIALIEFQQIFDTREGEPVQTSGGIQRCDGVDGENKLIKRSKKGLRLYLDITGNKALRFKRPAKVKPQVIALCREKARVELSYQTYKAPLRSDPSYTLVSLTNLKTGQSLFTAEDFAAWHKRNRHWAIGLMVAFSLGLVYCILVLTEVVHARRVPDFRRDLRGGNWHGEFRIRSRERSGEAWLYLIWFIALTLWFIYLYWKDPKEYWLLVAAVIFAAVAYAYLVEVVNLNELWFDEGHLLTRKTPLPWFGHRLAYPIDNIEQVYAEEVRKGTGHGPVVNFSLVLLPVEGEPLTLFFTTSLEEAEAIAELINQRLDELDGQQWDDSAGESVNE